MNIYFIFHIVKWFTEQLYKIMKISNWKQIIVIEGKVDIIISVFCPKAGPSLQAEKPTLQFCRRQVFHRKLGNQGCIFTRDLIGAVACRCFPHPTLSLASEQTLKDLKRSQGHQRGGEESGFG